MPPVPVAALHASPGPWPAASLREVARVVAHGACHGARNIAAPRTSGARVRVLRRCTLVHVHAKVAIPDETSGTGSALRLRWAGTGGTRCAAVAARKVACGGVSPVGVHRRRTRVAVLTPVVAAAKARAVTAARRQADAVPAAIAGRCRGTGAWLTVRPPVWVRTAPLELRLAQLHAQVFVNVAITAATPPILNPLLVVLEEALCMRTG